MAESLQGKGPWWPRVLITGLAVALGILFYWLLGFVVQDIGAIRGPDWQEVERANLSPDDVDKAKSLRAEIDELAHNIEDGREEQNILRDSTDSSRQTMNQLLEFQKLSVQSGVEPSAEEKEALAKAERLFLENQERYQALNERIAQQSEKRRALERQAQAVEASLDQQRQQARTAFEGLNRRHQLKVAGLKLAVLVPLLLIALFLFFKKRSSMYAPIVYAFGAAVCVKILVVMHRHFPSRYFKYILIVALIVAVLWLLVMLIRMVARPKRSWLLRQYKEAYERLLCPVCSYPIRRGPLRYAFWTRRSIVKRGFPASGEAAAPEEHYTCPACGTKVFEECASCHGVRPSLLPHCDKCGAEKTTAEA